jgi:hypothetical protein
VRSHWREVSHECFEVGIFEAEDWELSISESPNGEAESVPCNYIPLSSP